MYLREGPDSRPYLDLITDAQREPKLLREWNINMPFGYMNELYKLDPELYDNWRDHFVNRVYEHIYGRATEDPQGNMIPGAIGEEVLRGSQRRWNAWIDSTRDPSLFASVKLQAFRDYSSSLRSVMMLVPDVYCENCDESEPSWLYIDVDRSGRQLFTHQYGGFDKVLNYGLFGPTYLDLNACPHCNSEMYVTEYFSRFARIKMGSCECMPCRGRL